MAAAGVSRPRKKATKRFRAPVPLAVRRAFGRLHRRIAQYVGRRPHRSFRRTKSRDVPRRPAMPGYIALSLEAWRVILRFRGHFVVLTLIYVGVSTLLVGVVSQQNYDALTKSLGEVGPELLGGDVGALGRSGVLFGTAMLGGLNGTLGQAQALTAAVLGLLLWLVVVWLLRALFAGNPVSVRDALYNAGAPLIPTTLLGCLLLVQLLPGAFGLAAYMAVTNGTIIDGGVESMVLAAATALSVLLSLYWATATLLAGIIVTIPGTYPMAAVRAAGDLALGKRLPLLLRLLWLLVPIGFLWALLLLPALLIDQAWHVAWLPLVPFVVQVLGGLSGMYVVVYVYVLYRRLINET
jgi:hypothetical protein